MRLLLDTRVLLGLWLEPERLRQDVIDAAGTVRSRCASTGSARRSGGARAAQGSTMSTGVERLTVSRVPSWP